MQPDGAAGQAGMRAKVVRPPLLSGLRSLVIPRDEWEVLTACPVCAGEEHVVLAVGVVGSAPGSAVSLCLDCEHGFLSRRPTGRWLSAFYAGDWDARGKHHVERGKQARTVVASETIHRFCSAWLPERGRVLEIGAGFGAELLGFRDRGYEVVGVEPSSHRAAFVEETLGIRCHSTPFEEAPLEEAFDLAFTSHVLEHVADVRAFVAKAASILAPAGLLYVAVPTLWREPAVQAAHFVPHTSLFTPRSLTRLLESHGFHVLATDVGADLKILARLEPAEPSEAASSPETRRAFAESVARRLWETFGAKASTRVLVWHRARDKSREAYSERVFGAAAGRVVRRLHAHRKSLPTHRVRAAWKHSGPELLVSSSLRAFEISLSGGPRLPLTIDYGVEPAPVWVK